MLRNYFLVAWRTLRRQPVSTSIKILGLAIGIACVILIMLFVRYESSYDQFHEHHDRVYRLAYETSLFGGTQNLTVLPGPFGMALEAGLPEVIHAVRMRAWQGEHLFSNDTKRFYESGIVYADEGFFEVFSFPFLYGDPQTALSAPYNVVIPASMARKYFKGENPVGQTIMVDAETALTVTGVVEAFPENSHLQVSAVVSMATLARQSPRQLTNPTNPLAYTTYLLLGEDVLPDQVLSKIPAFVGRNMGEKWEEALAFYLEPLPDIYLDSEVAVGARRGSTRYLYIFSTVAFLILFVSMVNYVNLATVQSISRTKEVGIRKALGAQRSHLVKSFLAEALVVALYALMIVFVLVAVAMPYFSALISGSSSLTFAFTASNVLLVVLVTLGIGGLSGLIPAWLLSIPRPAEVLRRIIMLNSRGSFLRRCLVVFQFAVSIGLILMTAVVLRQLDYMRNAELGFEKEHVIVIALRGTPAQSQAEVLKRLVTEDPSVASAALTTAIPSRPSIKRKLEVASLEEPVWVNYYEVDPDFMHTLGLQIRAGRWFEPDRAADHSSVLINEAGTDHLGGRDIQGQTVDLGTPYEVIGLVQDFHTESLHQDIEPLVLAMIGTETMLPDYLVAKVQTDNLRELVSSFEKHWNTLVPEHPFNYFFLDDAFDQLYQAEDRLAGIFSSFTGIAILIACLGLFGLSAFTAQRRTKEIGVRKVLGASVFQIVLLLSKDFLKLVVIAGVLVTPIAYVFMDRWLNDFAYHIVIGVNIFVAAYILALIIAVIAVSYQSLSAALANPVETLRYE